VGPCPGPRLRDRHQGRRLLGLAGWLGHPPCVIRVGLGNVRNDAVLRALLQAHDRMARLFDAGDVGLIELS